MCLDKFENIIDNGLSQNDFGKTFYGYRKVYS